MVLVVLRDYGRATSARDAEEMVRGAEWDRRSVVVEQAESGLCADCSTCSGAAVDVFLRQRDSDALKELLSFCRADLGVATLSRHPCFCADPH
jgi:hypothetical protein